MTEITLDPSADQNGHRAIINLRDGSKLVVFRSPVSTYSTLVDAERCGQAATLEIVDGEDHAPGTVSGTRSIQFRGFETRGGARRVIDLDPSTVVSVTS